MDFFVVLGQWIDLGLDGLGFLWLLQLYRHRHMLHDSLWWTMTHHRQQWIERYIDAAVAQGQRRSAEQLIHTLEKIGHPLSPIESNFALNCQRAKLPHIIEETSAQGEEVNGTTREGTTPRTHQ
ncbi:MAG: hypothetical protein C7B46_12430 [Sulfobacillus benefaciens]|uniref:Uncharacterized protein n=1 Tax=Sulfobacillus benefaciens TaxID=453960 RepID=A0A2T2XEG9_9FIRM|nr:MAG: hypothetical protein C7B46_12430 [Sulfobacillus benefaciens]